VGNAIKFTAQGHVIVTAEELEREGEKSAIRISVADTGIGIAREKQHAIFEPFCQADGSTTRRYGGTGLGLAISSTLVHMMGARLTVHSEPGAGSTFEFTLTVDVIDADPPVRLSAPLAGAAILIADDVAANRQIIAAQVGRWQMAPVAVASADEAFETLAGAARDQRAFGVALVDASMPDKDGFTVVERLRQEPRLAGTKVVMMLGSLRMKDDLARCQALGVAACVTKPVSASELLHAVLLAMSSEPATTMTAPARTGTSTPTEPTKRRLSVLVAEDNVVNQRVAVGLLTSRGHRVIVANNGLEAIAAVERDTFDVVLMDVQMPEMGGYEATAVIRERERHIGRRQRIVAMTAHAMNGDRERCLAAGMDAYISKPLDPKALFAIVEGGTETSHPSAKVTGFDYEELLERFGGDRELLADVVRLFVEDCPARLEAIERAVASRDAERVRFEAHGLKGAAGNLSASGLFEAAAMLERLAAEARTETIDAAWRKLSAEANSLLQVLAA
jgi:CheY-like chemotaxis protein